MKGIIKEAIYFGAYIYHRNNDSKVVYYHDVSTNYTTMGTNLDLMKTHFEIVRQSGYTIVPNITKRQNQVMVCFDDGWAGIYDNKDFFIDHNIVPTIFIAVDLIGADGYMTVGQIRELQALGFQFECHTWSHQSLTLFDDDILKHELKDSKEELERLFGHPFTAICYPQGRFSMHIHNLCERYGYTRQFSSVAGGYYDMEDKGLICRMCAQFASPREFKWMLNSTSSFFRNRLIKQHVKGSL